MLTINKESGVYFPINKQSCIMQLLSIYRDKYIYEVNKTYYIKEIVLISLIKLWFFVDSTVIEIMHGQEFNILNIGM